MIGATEAELVYPLTDGNIALNNLQSARMQAWSRFCRDPLRPEAAESVVELEQLTLQFAGDVAALDRLRSLIDQMEDQEADSPRTAFMQAQFASITHRFSDAREFLAKASECTKLAEGARRLSLNIDQACAARLEAVLATRLQMAQGSGRLEDLVPLGALYADLREFEEAGRIYERAFHEYRDASPLAIAWVCFQLGVLWGELVPVPQASRAMVWYERAIRYLPCYVKARVHLAELYLQEERPQEAEALLLRALASGDAEVNWRLADVLSAMGRDAEAEIQMQAARAGFEALLEKHLLAFADHGAEFYAGSGDDARRAFELASINLANRPTLRAFELAYKTAVDADLAGVAAEILAASTALKSTQRFERLSHRPI
jgi:tetratricopeptide (TPR) repeat protein